MVYRLTAEAGKELRIRRRLRTLSENKQQALILEINALRRCGGGEQLELGDIRVEIRKLASHGVERCKERFELCVSREGARVNNLGRHFDQAPATIRHASYSQWGF